MCQLHHKNPAEIDCLGLVSKAAAVKRNMWASEGNGPPLGMCLVKTAGFHEAYRHKQPSNAAEHLERS